MNWQQVQGNWEQMKGKFKENWGGLTGDELDRAQGRREQIVGLLREKTGKANEEVEREVDSFLTRLK